MAWRALTDAQWERIRPPLPREKRRPQGGRPRADPRRCFEGILWVLWTGAPWSELPPRYGSPTRCWRRLRQWEETGVLLASGAPSSTSSTTGRNSAGTSASSTAASPRRKKGRQNRPHQPRQGNEVDGTGRWRGYSAGSIPGRGVPGGGHAPRENARESADPRDARTPD